MRARTFRQLPLKQQLLLFFDIEKVELQLRGLREFGRSLQGFFAFGAIPSMVEQHVGELHVAGHRLELDRELVVEEAAVEPVVHLKSSKRPLGIPRFILILPDPQLAVRNQPGLPERR